MPFTSFQDIDPTCWVSFKSNLSILAIVVSVESLDRLVTLSEVHLFDNNVGQIDTLKIDSLKCGGLDYDFQRLSIAVKSPHGVIFRHNYVYGAGMFSFNPVKLKTLF